MNDREMLEKIHSSVGLAEIYAEDGAFFTAARKLEQLAEEVKAYAEARNDDLSKFMSNEGEHTYP